MDAGFRIKITQEANNMKAACKRLFPDFDPSKLTPITCCLCSADLLIAFHVLI